MACGHFSDIGFVTAGKRRDFCRLLCGSLDQLKTDTPLSSKLTEEAAGSHRAERRDRDVVVLNHCFLSAAG